jgi:hypothetical protein
MRKSREKNTENQEPSEEQIREAAYLLWERAGSDPHADPNQYWEKAKKQLSR